MDSVSAGLDMGPLQQQTLSKELKFGFIAPEKRLLYYHQRQQHNLRHSSKVGPLGSLHPPLSLSLSGSGAKL
jgi:hypothetical protein